MDDKLKSLISSRPTNTILKHSSNEIEQLFKKQPYVYFANPVDLPISFNGKEVWEGLITTPYNQGTCGSCWSFASVSCLSDRFNIQSVGRYNIRLSPVKMLICNWGQGDEISVLENTKGDLLFDEKLNKDKISNVGCSGNTLIDAWSYLYLIGVPSSRCVPYTQDISTGNLPLCASIIGKYRDMCEDGVTPMRQYRAYHFFTVPGTDFYDDTNIMQEIYRYGPVTTGIRVYSDFYTFNPIKEIYRWNGTSEMVGGHAIVLVGWGEENLKKFWWARNSWGTEWGIDGYFKISRGNNECGIEANVVTGIPDFFYTENLYSFRNFHNQQELEQQKIDRFLIDKGDNIVGCGISAKNGFSRRVQYFYPQLDFEPKVKSYQLPDFNKFIAGIDASVTKRTKFIDSNKTHEQRTDDKTFLLLINITLAICILICALIILKSSSKSS